MKTKWKVLQRIAIVLTVILCVGCMSGFSSQAATTVLTEKFTMTDVRDSSKEITFDGQDGKYSIIVFGGVGTCYNTTAAVGYLNDLREYVDMNTLNMYVFDTYSNTAADIADSLNEEGIYMKKMKKTLQQKTQKHLLKIQHNKGGQ